LIKALPSQVKYMPELDPAYEGERPINWKTLNFNEYGILGDPLLATREKGEKRFDLIIRDIIRAIQDLSK